MVTLAQFWSSSSETGVIGGGRGKEIGVRVEKADVSAMRLAFLVAGDVRNGSVRHCIAIDRLAKA